MLPAENFLLLPHIAEACDKVHHLQILPAEILQLVRKNSTMISSFFFLVWFSLFGLVLTLHGDGTNLLDKMPYYNFFS